MSAVDIASSFIAPEESFSASPYWDVNGWAIGYGNHYYEDGTAVSSDDDPIDQARALEILNFFVAQNVAAIQSQVTVPLSDNQIAALTSLRYNCGTITNTLLSLINSGADPATVGSQIEKTCTTSGGLVNSSLIARRQQESALYQSADSPDLTNILVLGAVGIAVYLMLIK